MPESNTQTTDTRTIQTSNFDQRADKWWESRWAFIMAIAIPLLAVMGVYTKLQLNDLSQRDSVIAAQSQVQALQNQFILFINGDFKDQSQRIIDLTTSVNSLTVQVAQLQTIINERIPAK